MQLTLNKVFFFLLFYCVRLTLHKIKLVLGFTITSSEAVTSLYQDMILSISPCKKKSISYILKLHFQTVLHKRPPTTFYKVTLCIYTY